MVAVIWLLVLTVKTAGVPPKVTEVVPLNRSPRIVISLPPAVVLEVGSSEVMAGALGSEVPCGINS